MYILPDTHNIAQIHVCAVCKGHISGRCEVIFLSSLISSSKLHSSTAKIVILNSKLNIPFKDRIIKLFLLTK